MDANISNLVQSNTDILAGAADNYGTRELRWRDWHSFINIWLGHLFTLLELPLGKAPPAACFMSGPRKMDRGFGKKWSWRQSAISFAHPAPMSRGLAMYINKFPEGREAQMGRQAFFPRRLRAAERLPFLAWYFLTYFPLLGPVFPRSKSSL